ncbi:MAG: DUF2294 domain-containing protein [Spirulinaceae cyanobacterium]
MPDKTLPTSGQLERNLSQQIQKLYRDKVGSKPEKVACHLLKEKITIIIDEALTQPEQLLVDQGKNHLTEQVRSDLDKAVEEDLRELIEEIVGVKVVDLLMDTELESGRSGIIVILAQQPDLRRSNRS